MGRAGRGGGSRGGGSRGGGSRGGFSRSGGGRSRSGGGFRSSGFHFHRPPPPPGHHYHRHWGGRRYYGSGGASTAASFAAVLLVFGLVVLIWILPVLVSIFGNSGSITASTYAREPLEAGIVNETDYYDDQAGWFGRSSVLEDGMKYFYQETGVQPYLILMDEYMSVSECDEYTQSLYDTLFTDEAHLLYVFNDNGGNYIMSTAVGSAARQVMDDEAINILYDYTEQYYYGSLAEDDMFNEVFRNTADRIMSKTTSPIFYIVIGICVIVVVAIIGFTIRKATLNKAREAEATERILNSDLGDLPNTDTLNDLEDKYNE